MLNQVPYLATKQRQEVQLLIENRLKGKLSYLIIWRKDKLENDEESDDGWLCVKTKGCVQHRLVDE